MQSESKWKQLGELAMSTGKVVADEMSLFFMFYLYVCIKVLLVFVYSSILQNKRLHQICIKLVSPVKM